MELFGTTHTKDPEDQVDEYAEKLRKEEDEDFEKSSNEEYARIRKEEDARTIKEDRLRANKGGRYTHVITAKEIMEKYRREIFDGYGSDYLKKF